MSQARNRRMASRTRETGPEVRTAAPPAATGDVLIRNGQNRGSKNTHKIPKEVRYDLENALLGLCDVWFDEIKPHLVKNNLKLHTGGVLNENGFGELGEVSGNRRSRANQRNDGRSNLEPESVSDQGNLQCLLANAARGIELAVSQASCAALPAATNSQQIL